MAADTGTASEALGELNAAAVATLSPAARRAHRTILEHFVAFGEPPPRSLLQGLTATVRDELTSRDVVAFHPDRALRAAYPLSPTPTGINVAVQDGPTLFATCAIDALGVAAMLARPVAIEATEPSPAAAQEWATAHPHITGTVIDLPGALALGVAEFADLLHEQPGLR